MKRRDFLKLLGISAVAPNITWEATPQHKIPNSLPQIVKCQITATFNLEQVFTQGELVPYEIEEKPEITLWIKYDNEKEATWQCDNKIWTTHNAIHLNEKTPCRIVNNTFYYAILPQEKHQDTYFLQLDLIKQLS